MEFTEDVVTFHAMVAEVAGKKGKLDRGARIRLHGLYMAATSNARPVTGLCPCNGQTVYDEQEAWRRALEESRGDQGVARRSYVEFAREVFSGTGIRKCSPAQPS